MFMQYTLQRVCVCIRLIKYTRDSSDLSFIAKLKREKYRYCAIASISFLIIPACL